MWVLVQPTSAEYIIDKYGRDCHCAPISVQGFSIVTLNFSVGLIIGPTIGGALYGTTETGFLGDYPWALPCFVCGMYTRRSPRYLRYCCSVFIYKQKKWAPVRTNSALRMVNAQFEWV